MWWRRVGQHGFLVYGLKDGWKCVAAERCRRVDCCSICGVGVKRMLAERGVGCVLVGGGRTGVTCPGRLMCCAVLT